MRLIRTIATVAVSAALFTTPALAANRAPNAAGKLSLAGSKQVRAASTLHRGGRIEAGMIIGFVAAAAVVAGIIIVGDDSDSK